MSRRLSPLTPDVVRDLPSPCAACLSWEIDPRLIGALDSPGAAEAEKAGWVEAVYAQWGTCGRLIHVDDAVAGYVTYAPAALVPRAGTFPTSPVSPDAVLFMTGGIVEEHRGAGLGRMLLQSMAKDLTRRGFRAIEAFGSTRRVDGPLGSEPGCLLPEAFLTAVGFRVVRPHRDTPRLRLDLRSALAWKEDVESALERLLGTVRVPVLSSRDTQLP